MRLQSYPGRALPPVRFKSKESARWLSLPKNSSSSLESTPTPAHTLSPPFMPPQAQWPTPRHSQPPPWGWTVRSPGSGGAQAARGSSRPSRARPPTAPGSPRPCLPLTSRLAKSGHPRARPGPSLTGKSDPIDAEAAARSVLGRPREQVMEPHAAGARAAIRILLASRSLLDHQRTANRNAVTALLRGTDLGIDARSFLRDAQITAIAAWRTSNSTDPVIQIARAEAKRLALAVKDVNSRLAENHKALAQLTEELAPGLQSISRGGPVTAAIMTCAYSHHGRIRSEAAFAALGGVAPRPASSGNTSRHRLNRSGDRQLNRAFDVIVRTRMSFDTATKDYVTRSRATGKSKPRNPPQPQTL